jgi:LysR family transcriptional regulator, glycine cleavage system transcriptional activator
VGAKAVNPGQGLQFDTSLTAFEVAAQGGGVALGRHSLAQRDRASGRLVAPFGIEIPINEAFHLLEPVGKTLHPDASHFIEWVTAVASENK